MRYKGNRQMRHTSWVEYFVTGGNSEEQGQNQQPCNAAEATITKPKIAIGHSTTQVPANTISCSLLIAAACPEDFQARFAGLT
jgi:hypothetical protein